MDPGVARVLGKSIGAGVVPAFFSLGLLARLWWIGELYGGSGRVFCCWFLIALATQTVGVFQILSAGQITAWVLGLTVQSLLAIALVLKKQWTDV